MAFGRRSHQGSFSVTRGTGKYIFKCVSVRQIICLSLSYIGSLIITIIIIIIISETLDILYTSNIYVERLSSYFNMRSLWKGL